MRVRPPTPGELVLERRTALEVSKTKLVAALEAEAVADAVRLLPEFESDLLAQLEAEEAYVLGAPDRASSRDVSLLVHEHRHLRSRLSEIGPVVANGDLTELRHFLDELGAHARCEAQRSWSLDLDEIDRQ